MKKSVMFGIDQGWSKATENTVESRRKSVEDKGMRKKRLERRERYFLFETE